mmetsp:Transcript_52874/g.59112  ORF Transcript_52874/g.59112 Transcript_52874/m.59112 type:complete len:310 (-) Transcript_52874:83-1012(-)
MSDKEEGWDLATCDPKLKEVLVKFDYNGDGFVSKDEVAKGADLYVKEEKKNKKQKKQMYVLLVGYFFLVVTIAGLVYGVVKANKDSQVVAVSGMSSAPLLSMDSQPVSINTNEIDPPLGVISFLPFHALSKIKDIVISVSTGDDDDNQAIMRRVAGIDVVANASFLITTTMGDTLVWDSRSNNTPIDQLNVTLHDGTEHEGSVLCTTCSAINAVWDDKDIIDSLDAYTNFFFDDIEETIDGDEVESDGKGGRQLGKDVRSGGPFGTNARGTLTVHQQRMMGIVLPFGSSHSNELPYSDGHSKKSACGGL